MEFKESSSSSLLTGSPSQWITVSGATIGKEQNNYTRGSTRSGTSCVFLPPELLVFRVNVSYFFKVYASYLYKMVQGRFRWLWIRQLSFHLERQKCHFCEWAYKPPGNTAWDKLRTSFQSILQLKFLKIILQNWVHICFKIGDMEHLIKKLCIVSKQWWIG